MENKITKDMKIGDILQNFPNKSLKLSQIMTSKGLHCVGCGAATMETLEQGSMGHGFTEQQVNALVDELNKELEAPDYVPGDGPLLTLTDTAVSQLIDILKEEKKESWGLRLEVVSGGCSGSTYNMSLREEADEGDVVVEQDNVKIFIEKNSVGHFQDIQIDYVSNDQGSGFAFKRPHVHSGGCCG